MSFRLQSDSHSKGKLTASIQPPLRRCWSSFLVLMPATDTPLTRDRILATAKEVIRRFGLAKANVVDVARALGVSHAAVYRHVATKAELQGLVLGRWVEATMPPLRAIAAKPGSAPKRLRQLFDALVAIKRRQTADDPELLATYRALASDTRFSAAYLDQLVAPVSSVIRSGVKEGTFRTVDPVAAGRAVCREEPRIERWPYRLRGQSTCSSS